MSWIKENKFIAGFGGATLVAAGALGFLMIGAKGRYEDAVSNYEQKATELTRLQSLAPYPAPENLKAIEKQKKEHQDAIDALQANLSTKQLPLEPMTDVQFQDTLKQSVQRVIAKAQEHKVALGSDKPGENAKFYLGFDPYQTEPPKPAAAAPLGRQLKAIEMLVSALIDNNVVSLGKIERQTLPEEREGEPAKAKTGQNAQGGKGGGKEAKESKPLVSKHYVDLSFTADQNAFRQFFNTVVGNEKQFFIVRRVDVKNQARTGPPKADPNAAAAAAAPADQAAPAATPGAPAAPAPAAATPAAAALKYIVGEEKLDVAMRIDIVDFAEPGEATGKSGGKKK